jgi:hypothetical protein
MEGYVMNGERNNQESRRKVAVWLKGNRQKALFDKFILISRSKIGMGQVTGSSTKEDQPGTMHAHPWNKAEQGSA